MKTILVLVLLCTAACSGTTGNRAVTFAATAHGPSGVAAPFSFTNALGYSIVLDHATLHIGAVYLNQNVPTILGRTGCFLDGIYTGEVLHSLDVDALSASPQRFLGLGQGTETESHTGELWLTGGAIDAVEDTTVILNLTGTATNEAAIWPFSAQLTVGTNRQLPPPDAAEPGGSPLCKQRVVTPIRVDLTPSQNGTLDIVVDPRLWLGIVDFSQLPSNTFKDGTYVFANAGTNGADVALFDALTSSGAYELTWRP